MTDSPKLFPFAGEQYPMTLNHPWVRANISVRGLPGEGGASAAACYKRFNDGQWNLDDIEHIIWLGLIGAGLSRRESADLVERHVRQRPIMEYAATAFDVLATLFMAPTDPAPETEGADNG